MKKLNQKVKKFFKENFDKTKFFASMLTVFVCGIIVLGAVKGEKNTDIIKTEPIVLQTLTPPEILFNKNEVKKEELEPIKETFKKEEIKAEEKTSEPIFEDAFKISDEKEEFSLEIDESLEILNGFSGEKLVKSKTMGDWRAHGGIDVITDEVKAFSDGTVSEVYFDELMGHTVKLEHEDEIFTVYSNLDDNITVKKGDKITKGDIIGKAGKSAIIESEEEPHLHFEVIKDGKKQNPGDYRRSK